MSTRRRRWFLEGLCLAAAATLGIAGFQAFGGDDWEAAYGRVPLGADRRGAVGWCSMILRWARSSRLSASPSRLVYFLGPIHRPGPGTPAETPAA